MYVKHRRGQLTGGVRQDPWFFAVRVGLCGFWLGCWEWWVLVAPLCYAPIALCPCITVRYIFQLPSMCQLSCRKTFVSSQICQLAFRKKADSSILGRKLSYVTSIRKELSVLFSFRVRKLTALWYEEKWKLSSRKRGDLKKLSCATSICQLCFSTGHVS